MIEVISTNASVTTGNTIPLQTVSLLKGCSVRPLNNTFVFKAPGVYEVNVNATAVSGTATGSVGIQISKNGTLVGVPNSETVDDTTSIHSLGLTNLIRVDNCCPCNPTTITIQNVGNTATISMDAVITKIY